MKQVIIAIVVVVIGVSVVLALKGNVEPQEQPIPLDEHTYTTLEPLEFDKCCAMWLIRRFIDSEAEFKIYPLGTYLTGPNAFDVGGAAWSRQHRKCTSDCIWEELDVNDAAAEQIVQMAHQIELNRWHLEQFPQARKCDTEFRQIIDNNPDPNECIKQSIEYFDALYEKLRESKTTN
ncbi:chromate resistance protein ChrB domain-containing protein [Planctomycetota bacterium]